MSQNLSVTKKQEKKQQEWSRKYIAIGVMACVGGLIYQLITGALYQWGIINIYVTSYYKTLDPSVTLQSNAVAFPIMMFCMGLPMRFGIYLAEISHPMIVLITCQILLSLSIFISSFVTSMWVFIFFYGILFGLLVGSAFMIPIIECNKYFPGMKNYVNGCILIGTGSGSVVFGMFSYTFLNPNQDKPLAGYYYGSPDLQEIANRVPTLLKYLSLMYLGFGMLGIAMMSPVIIGNRRRQNKKLQEQKEKRQQAQRNGINLADDAVLQPAAPVKVNEALSLKQAFCSWICWVEVAIVLLTACGLYLINGNYKTYVKKTINDDYFLTIAGAVGAIGNGCSRFVWNFYFLKTGYKTVMLTILGISITVYSTIRFTVQIKGIYFLQVFLVNCCIGGLLVSTPTMIQYLYGQRTGSNIYGFYWEVVASANFIQYLFVSNLSKTIGFDPIIYICLGMACLAVPIVLFTKFQGPWENDTTSLEYCISCQQTKVPQTQTQNDQTMEALDINLVSKFNSETVKVLNETECVSSPIKKPPTKLQPLSPQIKDKIKTKEVNLTHKQTQQENANSSQEERLESKSGSNELDPELGRPEQVRKASQGPSTTQDTTEVSK